MTPVLDLSTGSGHSRMSWYTILSPGKYDHSKGTLFCHLGCKEPSLNDASPCVESTELWGSHTFEHPLSYKKNGDDTAWN